ncbi:MAG: anaerobic ribonucleoside-triphosphate reductase activating protein [Halobacteriota archaeon]
MDGVIVQLNFDDFDKTKIVPFSTIDWTGKAAMIVFLKGCNFKCRYCQNFRIAQSFSPVAVDELLSEIRRNKEFINALIFSGGEPTLHPVALKILAAEAKHQGLQVGIETNGSFPKVLETMISMELLDGLFIDVKAPLINTEKYTQITGVNIKEDCIRRIRKAISVGHRAFIRHALTELELRTTLFKSMLSDTEIKELVNQFPDIPYALQQGRTELCPQRGLVQMTRIELIDVAKQCSRALKVRTQERGEEDIF